VAAPRYASDMASAVELVVTDLDGTPPVMGTARHAPATASAHGPAAGSSLRELVRSMELRWCNT